MTDTKIVCAAIREHRLLSFLYNGLPRLVQPYCHGTNHKNVDVLRAIQIGGRSTSGGLGMGKLWIIAKMRDVRLEAQRFTPDDPHYNPDDSAMAHIHCRVSIG